MVILNAYIYPVVGCPIENGYLRFDRQISEMGPMTDYVPQAGEQVWDAQGSWVLPGLIDIHTHLGLWGDGESYQDGDGNEEGDPITPQLRVIDGINPGDPTFRESLAAGVTAVVVVPGSANPIGGQGAAIRTCGRRIDDMLIRAPLCVKFALGENPKGLYRDRDETPVTRMGTAAMIRQALFEARDYGARKQAALDNPELDPPDFDMKHEALLPLLRREVQAHFHAHRLDDIFTAIRIAREFDLDYVIVHGTEGHLAADILAEEGARVIVGPTLMDRGKLELKHSSFSGPATLQKAGVLCAICTDHPETPLKLLPLCAAMAAKCGMGHDEALAAITINPAKIAGLDGRLGSLEPGKDADIAVFSGDPLDLRSEIRAVFSLGRKCV